LVLFEFDAVRHSVSNSYYVAFGDAKLFYTNALII